MCVQLATTPNHVDRAIAAFAENKPKYIDGLFTGSRNFLWRSHNNRIPTDNVIGEAVLEGSNRMLIKRMLLASCINNYVACKLTGLSQVKPLLRKSFVCLCRVNLLRHFEAPDNVLLHIGHFSRNDEDMIARANLTPNVGPTRP